MNSAREWESRLGHKAFKSNRTHDFFVGVIDYGWIAREGFGKDRWFEGRPEILGGVFGGAQYRPDHAYIVGAAPLLRYNFTGLQRRVPFIQGGGGVAATDIGRPDLGSTFESNVQGGVGVRYLLTQDVGLTLEYRYIHFSNAGIRQPNVGVNANVLLMGVSWFSDS